MFEKPLATQEGLGVAEVSVAPVQL